MFIFSNLAISLDGKIAPRNRGFHPLGTELDWEQMQALRSQCDALLIGASTFRTFRKPSLVTGAKKQPINMILSSNLQGISPRWEFFQTPELTRILLVGPNTQSKLIKKFQGSSEIV